MTIVTFQKNYKFTNTKFVDFSSFIEDFVKNNYEDSNIENEYSVASDMQNIGLPDNFIKNFIRSYEKIKNKLKNM